MAKAIFVCPFTEGGPDLDIAQLVGNPPTDGYGWSCIGQIPQAPTCLVLVSSSEEVLDALAADEAYLFVEDVSDG
ncbi:MAG TPA: hypothetical protein PKA43_00175 [Candidatus Competibacter phosphatis]|mgnify:CR=1 FL=1|nr:hypothetical protein [Candidatus Competibacter phosphatis]